MPYWLLPHQGAGPRGPGASPGLCSPTEHRDTGSKGHSATHLPDCPLPAQAAPETSSPGTDGQRPPPCIQKTPTGGAERGEQKAPGAPTLPCLSASIAWFLKAASAFGDGWASPRQAGVGVPWGLPCGPLRLAGLMEVALPCSVAPRLPGPLAVIVTRIPTIPGTQMARKHTATSIHSPHLWESGSATLFPQNSPETLRVHTGLAGRAGASPGRARPEGR